MQQYHKFFNANSIMKVLMVVNSTVTYGSGVVPPRENAIFIMKPYIAPLSTNEAIQILSMFNGSDGIGSGVLVS